MERRRGRRGWFRMKTYVAVYLGGRLGEVFSFFSLSLFFFLLGRWGIKYKGQFDSSLLVGFCAGK